MPQLDSTTWDTFVARTPGGSFLQSWGWGEVQRAFGVPIWRLAVWRGGAELAGAALVLKRPVPSGQCWLYVPRGPIYEQRSSGRGGTGEGQEREALMKQMAAQAREQRAIFVRIEPPDAAPAGEAAEEKLSFLELGGSWQKADHDVQPRCTLVIDLKPAEEELLAAMHHKTRYNIGLARRRGVTVRFSREAADLNSFLQLAWDVSARSSFRFHPDGYFRAMHEALGSGRTELEMAVAERGGEVLAVHLLVSFGDTVTYVHGASSSRRRELMAPHVLQWESMRRAKARGFRYYDFFGIAPQAAAPAHLWAGITRFKEGFGGQRVRFPGAYDLVMNPLTYWLYNAARRLSH